MHSFIVSFRSFIVSFRSLIVSLRSLIVSFRSQAQIYHQIKDHTGETRSDIITLSADLNDYRAAWECALKQVFELIVQGYSTVATTIGD